MSILGVFKSRVSGKFYVLQEEMHDGLALAGGERRQH
jgi:hypothetical protein